MRLNAKLSGNKKIRFRLFLAGVCACITAIFVSVFSCLPSNVDEPTAIFSDPWKNLPVNSYTTSAFYNSKDGLKRYSDCDIRLGIDVSEHQEHIDWSTLKNKIDFAFIRVGYRGYETGLLNIDDFFKANMNGAIQNGIDVGVYFFSQAVNESEAVEEAEYVLEKIQQYDVKYPIVYDMEWLDGARAQSLGVGEKTSCAIAFCERIKKAGYTPMIYGNINWFLYSVNLPELKEYELWLAEYGDVPSFPYDFKVWQYTDSGSITDVEGKYDLNIWFEN